MRADHAAARSLLLPLLLLLLSAFTTAVLEMKKLTHGPSEVRDLGRKVTVLIQLEQDVLELYVTVNYAVLVQIAEAGGDLLGEANQLYRVVVVVVAAIPGGIVPGWGERQRAGCRRTAEGTPRQGVGGGHDLGGQLRTQVLSQCQGRSARKGERVLN